MKKKFFGVKFGTVLGVVLCIVVAVALWFMVKYSQIDAADVAGLLAPALSL